MIILGGDDGFKASDFHGKCDGKSNTVVIIKPKGINSVFGATTSARYGSSSGWVRTTEDPTPYLFSIRRGYLHACLPIPNIIYNKNSFILSWRFRISWKSRYYSLLIIQKFQRKYINKIYPKNFIFFAPKLILQELQ